MGKKRIAIVGEEPTKEKKRATVKTGKDHGRITDMGAEALAEAEKIAAKAPEKAPKKAKPRVAKAPRGRRYQEARKKVDPNKFYPLVEAIKLLKNTSITRFNGSIDVHLNVKEIGLKGEVQFPYPTGKKQNIRIADDQLIKELEQGKINFTTLIATPEIMSKLLKFAKLLGPKGLMPNPKAGTISDKPQELAKQLAGKVQFRTETKAPLIHMVIGKVDDKEEQLAANFQALIKAVGRNNIKKAVLTSTMGPGVKVDLASI